jgi:hypothetical protein
MPAENRHRAFIAAKSHFRVLAKNQESAVSSDAVGMAAIAVVNKGWAMTTYHSSLAENQRVFKKFSFR